MAINIGSPAIDRAGYNGEATTFFTFDNPANATGTIDTVKVWAKNNVTNLRVGMFFLVSGTTYECRDSEAVGAVTAGSEQTFTGLTISVETGDYIGYYCGADGVIEWDFSGGNGCAYVSGEYIDPTDQASYNVVDYDVSAMSINGTGTEAAVAPTVTTQAVSDIQPTTATGNGNITDTGGENCSKRGVCWNTGGNPTVADSKSEETGSFGTGAFSRSMTGLTPGQHYYVKAYAYNSAGYGYGSQVEFTASQLLQPNAIPSAEAFGTAKLNLKLTASAIGSLEAFGSAKLVLYLKPSAIPSGEAFGTPTLGTFLSPSSIASEEAFGAPIIAGPILVTGIASGEQFGTPIVTPGGVIVAPTGISSEELFGLPKLNVFVTPSGIVTSEALGTAKLNLKLILTGIASAEAFGTPTVKMILVIRPSGIASVELFGTPLLIVILAGGDGMKLPTTKGQVSIPSKEVSI